jgi:hypothetical protein
MSCNPTGIGRMSAIIAMAGRPQSGEVGRGGEGVDHKGVFARKPVADIIALEGGAFKSLPKVLGPFSITAMGVGAIIGAAVPVALAPHVGRITIGGGIAHRRRPCPARLSSWRSYGAAG